RLFGDFDLRLADGRVALVESARARSLLGFLVLHGATPQPRQHVAFQLWPDSTEPQARTNLRKVLHTLRHEVPGLEGHLAVTPRTLIWRSDVPAWVDVTAFDGALEAVEAAGAISDDDVGSLRTAVGLYRGELLEGTDDEWVV